MISNSPNLFMQWASAQMKKEGVLAGVLRFWPAGNRIFVFIKIRKPRITAVIKQAQN
jgi:hypothetical protein